MLSEAKHLDVNAIRILRFFAEFILSEAEGLRMTFLELLDHCITFTDINNPRKFQYILALTRAHKVF